MAMRELTNDERDAMQAPLRKYLVKRDGLLPKETRAFGAGFVAGIDYQQAKIDKLENSVDALLAFVNGKITRGELEEIIRQ